MPDARPVRLNIISDLHLGQGSLPVPSADCEIVVLAGDISRPAPAMEWARGIQRPVLYVPGNHEFYGGSLRSRVAELKQYADGTNICILDNEQIVLHGVRFLGSTLWSDFNLYGPGAPREQAIEQALAFIRDFVRIRSDINAEANLSPEEIEAVFQFNRDWLERKLGEHFDGPTVVITHHAPSPKSIHPRFEGSPINACFVSNSEYLLGAERAALWIHGHTHDSFDYMVNGTRVLCNPRGYARNGINENKHFDPNLVVQIDTA